MSFTVPRGSTYGVIGRNGSGKSTALKLVAGITKPTSGTVRVDGRISALIELGAGFHPEISGRENVYINGIMLGLTKRQVQDRFDEIVDFAELREFIDAPVKTYSSGMYMRLGFAVAIHVDPDVLLVDEVLAVGDEGFVHKCLDKFSEFRRRGKTILLVTHSLNLVERFCDERDLARRRPRDDTWGSETCGRRLSHRCRGDRGTVARGNHGQARRGSQRRDQRGFASRGADQTTPASEPVDPTSTNMSSNRRSLGHAGSRDHRRQLSRAGPGCRARLPHGQPMSVRVKVRAKQPTDDVVFGIGLFNADGVCCYGTNTYIEDVRPEGIEGDAEATFAISSLDLVEGTYKVDVAVHKRDGYPYDYHRLLYTFGVKSRTHDVGIYRPRHTWTFSPNVRFKTDV